MADFPNFDRYRYLLLSGLRHRLARLNPFVRSPRNRYEYVSRPLGVTQPMTEIRTAISVADPFDEVIFRGPLNISPSSSPSLNDPRSSLPQSLPRVEVIITRPPSYTSTSTYSEPELRQYDQQDARDSLHPSALPLSPTGIVPPGAEVPALPSYNSSTRPRLGAHPFVRVEHEGPAETIPPYGLSSVRHGIYTNWLYSSPTHVGPHVFVLVKDSLVSLIDL